MENLIFNTILESYALHKIVPESCAMTVMAMLMMPLLMTTMAMAVQAVAAMLIGPGAWKVFTMMAEKTPRWRRPCQSYPQWRRP